MHCIMSGICTSAIVLAQYLMITFRRGSISFTREVWWQIGGPGLIAMMMAPLVFWVLHWLGTGDRLSLSSASEDVTMNRRRISPRLRFNFSGCSCCSGWARSAAALVGAGGARSGMDRANSRQLRGNGAHSIGSR